MKRAKGPSFPLRGLEQRPLTGDPVEYVENLVRSGFDVSTIGAMNGRGLAGYPTDFLPPVRDMDPGWIPGVIREAHARGITLICWNVFNIQDVRDVDEFEIAKLHPEWKMSYIEDPGREFGERAGMCVISSPYLEHHARLLQEVAALGVDAMWFDGFYLGGIPHPIRPGCTCGYCRERFRREYGLDLPERVNWEDPVFRRWVRWRNEKLTEAARYVTAKIREIRPELPVIFNYNQWPFGTKDWPNAIPLWRTTDYGVSQHAYTSDERMQWVMLGYKAQLSHDLNPDYSDIWRTGQPIFEMNESGEDLAKHELQILLHLMAAMTYGTIPWRSTHKWPDIQRRNNLAVEIREEYFSTCAVRYAGLVVSQDTHDFHGHRPGAASPADYRDAVLGSWLLLTEAHVQFELVFDNQLDGAGLEGFEVLVLADTVCISDARMEALMRWVEEGGLLVSTGTAGTCDEWGDPIPRSRLSTGDRGKGAVLAFDSDPGRDYARTRGSVLSREFVDAVRARTMPIRVSAPEYVAVKAYEGDGGFVVQCLNVSAYYRYADGCGFRGVEGSGAETAETASDAEQSGAGDSGAILPFQTRPCRGVTLTFPGKRVRTARAVVSGKDLEPGPDGTVVIGEILEHETVVIELDR